MDSDTSPLISDLCNPRAYPHPVAGVSVIETHISWVLLTGDWAYKIKKPVDLGFVDFSTLAKRKFFCEEELRLNRRLAADLYESVVSLTCDEETVRVAGSGPVVEYAVRMRQFAQEDLLISCLRDGRVNAQQILQLATTIAEFHARLPAEVDDVPERSVPPILPARNNLQTLASACQTVDETEMLLRLKEWTENEYTRCAPVLAARRKAGFVRECHGDLHAGNMVLMGDEIRVFDCIEFNASLRWIDVMSEIAFVTMDFAERGCPRFSSRFLNEYLEITGDYAGVDTLAFFSVYRALVRAKVAALREQQTQHDPEAYEASRRERHLYLQLAEQLSRKGSPALLITHGFSGSGKSWGTVPLIEELGAIRLRSDVERKRLAGFARDVQTGDLPGQSLYVPARTEETYDRLLHLAESLLRAGRIVVVDATFLRRQRRDAFRALAEQLGVPFAILDFSAPEEVLRKRIAARQLQGEAISEAGLSVLEHQLRNHDPVSADEPTLSFGPTSDPDSIGKRVQQFLVGAEKHSN